MDKDKIFDSAMDGFLEIAKPDSRVSAENVAKGVATAIVKALEEYESQKA